MQVTLSSPRERVRAGVGAAVATALVGWALVIGLRDRPRPQGEEVLETFDLAVPPQPQVRTVPRRTHSRRPEGAAAPPNLRAEPTELVAPPPVIPLPPPPVAAAPIAGIGSAPSAGTADVPGPGTGAGGEGVGRGSGGDGLGDGGGDDETPPRRIKGRLKDSDYPAQAGDAGIGGTVSVRYHVEVNGRVTGCMVTRSSGNAALDDTTCRLIEKRFRYDPSRDADGRPVRSIIVVDHDWIIEQEPPPPDR